MIFNFLIVPHMENVMHIDTYVYFYLPNNYKKSATASFMKTVPSVYTLIINNIYLSHSS